MVPTPKFNFISLESLRSFIRQLNSDSCNAMLALLTFPPDNRKDQDTCFILDIAPSLFLFTAQPPPVATCSVLTRAYLETLRIPWKDEFEGNKGGGGGK